MKHSNKHFKQQGVALITALLITMLAVSVATAVIYRQQIHIRLSGNISHLEQAYLYADGMESFAGAILEKSFKDHPKYDSFKDDWAFGHAESDVKNEFIVPIEGGTMSGKIFDLQGRINLNALSLPPPEKPLPPEKNTEQPKNPNNPNNPNQTKTKKEPKPDIAQVTRDRLQNLMQDQDAAIDPDSKLGPAYSFAVLVKDWIDSDNENGNTKPDEPGTGNGAESDYYQSLEPAYFCANTLMKNPTELRLIKDMNKDIYNKLINNKNPDLSLVATLPINKKNKTPININTANKQVLKAIGLDPGSVEDIIAQRKIEPFENIKNPFLDSIFGRMSEGFSKDNLDVKSHYFLLRGKVEIDKARLYINSVLYRKNGKVSVIMRDFSNP